LKPTPWTALSMLVLVRSPTWMIERGVAPGMGHFVKLFGDATKAYIERVVSLRRPRAVAVCMLYYPDEKASGSWADRTLGALGYDADPTKLQSILRILFERATSRICGKIEGVETIVPVPLYEALDGKNPEDYAARVEPSERGGCKMARLLLDSIDPILRGGGAGSGAGACSTASMPASAENSSGADKPDVRIAAMPSPTHLRS